jgi:hypothetical protein
MRTLLQRKSVVMLSALVLGSSLVGLLRISGNEKVPNILRARQPTAALIYKMPDKTSINKPFKAVIEMDTQGNNVNAVGIYLKYDPNFLQLTNMDTTQSFCQFYPEKKFDNNLGTISLACGSPHPGISGKDTLLELEFIPRRIGSTRIWTDPNSQILVSDGKGTNILNVPVSTEITVMNTL